MLKKLIPIVAGVVVVYSVWQAGGQAPQTAGGEVPVSVPQTTRARPPAPVRAAPAARTDALEHAIAAHQRDVHVAGFGVVTKVLRDDTQGSRHQRFLLQTQTGHSLLVAYNLDIAPRIAGLRSGAPVSFSGEYIWNDRGGLVHWTHRDPAHRHSDGYIRYDGHLYQ